MNDSFKDRLARLNATDETHASPEAGSAAHEPRPATPRPNPASSSFWGWLRRFFCHRF